MPVVEQTLAGAVNFDGLTVGTGLVETSALKVRPERILLLSVYYTSLVKVDNLILNLTPPGRPLDIIEVVEIPKTLSGSQFIFVGELPLPILDNGRNFDIRFITTGKLGDGTAGFDFIYKAF